MNNNELEFEQTRLNQIVSKINHSGFSRIAVILEGRDSAGK